MSILKVSLNILLFFTVAFLLGCPPSVTIGEEESNVQEKITLIEYSILPGTTSRKRIQDLWGEAIISSESWRLEVYTFKDSDFFLSGPATSPIFPINIHEYIFLLVIYDKNWVVTDFDAGYFIEGTYWTEPTKGVETKSAIADDHILDFYDLTNKKFEPHKLYLLAPEKATRPILKTKINENNCELYLIESGNFDCKIFLDENPFFNPNFWDVSPILITHIAPGKHVIDVDPNYPLGKLGKFLDFEGEITKEIVCKQSEKIFIEMQYEVTTRDTRFKKYLQSANFNIMYSPSRAFLENRVILYHNEKWVGPEKPN